MQHHFFVFMDKDGLIHEDKEMVLHLVLENFCSLGIICTRYCSGCEKIASSRQFSHCDTCGRHWCHECKSRNETTRCLRCNDFFCGACPTHDLSSPYCYQESSDTKHQKQMDMTLDMKSKFVTLLRQDRRSVLEYIIQKHARQDDPPGYKHFYNSKMDEIMVYNDR